MPSDRNPDLIFNGPVVAISGPWSAAADLVREISEQPTKAHHGAGFCRRKAFCAEPRSGTRHLDFQNPNVSFRPVSSA
jgi:hypothetical protein